MDVKEYLSQARLIDLRIDNKIEQIQSLNALITKTTTAINEVCVQTSHNPHKNEDAIAEIIELEDEITCMMCKLTDLKKEISNAIYAVDDINCQIVLESRYLQNKRWEQIAVDMSMSLRGVYAIHEKALKMIKMPESCSKLH